MTKSIDILSQAQLEELIKNFDWAHAFVREVYVLTPSYVEPESLGVVAPDSKASMKLTIFFQDEEFPGLELIFEEVQEIKVSFQVGLNPVGMLERGVGVKMNLNGSQYEAIEAKKLSYSYLDKSSWGWKTKYGMYNLFDKSGISIE